MSRLARGACGLRVDHPQTHPQNARRRITCSHSAEKPRNVSEEGKDFIRKLLIKTKEKRLNAHECLQHQWLTGDHSHKTLEIARNRFFAIREKIRQKYANWNEFVLPLGRLSEFSSLRKLQTEKYRMQEVLIDRKCAAPRFVIKPQSTFALEGNVYLLLKIFCIFLCICVFTGYL